MPHIEIAAEKIFEIWGFTVTNTLLMGWIAVLILGFAAWFISRKIGLIPNSLQNVFELVVDRFLDLMAGVFGSREKAVRYFPLVTTIFLFILVSNWLGIFPGIGSVGFFLPPTLSTENSVMLIPRTDFVETPVSFQTLMVEKVRGGGHDNQEIFVPLFRSAASDLNFTLALAVTTVLIINFMGISAIGAAKHFSKFFSFKGPVEFFVGILELISEIAKMISFSFRLFGNVFAGEVLLVITAFLVPVFIPVPFLMLEIFVGFIQALVFAMLTMVFISIAVVEHH